VGRAEVKDLVATVDSFAMRLWGGTVTASGSADLKPPRPTYRFSTRVRGLEIQDAVASRFQLFKNTVVGKASFEMTGEGASFNPLAARDSLKAKGKLRVDEATFATIDVAKMVTEGLNKALERVGEKVPPLRGRKVKGPPGGGSKYEFISSDFTIGGGVFRAPNFVAKALPDRGIDLKGDTTVGLRDSSLKTSWEISDTYNLTKARELGDGMLAEGKGPVRFPVSAGCTLTAPCYSYTEAPEFLAKVALGNLTRGAQGRAKEELRKKIAPKVQDKLKGIGKKFFGR
ncbi:MAG: AsmA-like C-terminal region-containing protein, partial [Oligoflexia bacterium]|nr:AsmA-like C-terminal region-containing protein [Oligoflexia bacterium]